MKISVPILLSFLLWSSVACSQDVTLVYSEMQFHIPDGYSVIGSTDLAGGMLAFRYSEERGKKYITFTSIKDNKTSDHGCLIGEFYNELFSPSKTTNCNKKHLDELKETLLKNRVTKVWRSSNAVFNYLKFDNSSDSIVFVCKNDGTTIQIDSDFFTEEDYKNLFDND